MKKAVKWSLVVAAAIFALIAGYALSYALPLLSLKPAETGQIPGTGIFAVKNRLGCAYFYGTSGGYIMIDAGSDAKKIEASLYEEGINANDVRWIFLTHSDADHVAALTMFPNAIIHMGEDELPLLNGAVKRSLILRNKLPDGISVDKINLLRDDQELSCGGIKVECLKTPGHTIGSMSYMVDDRYLFTGDAFKLIKGIMGVHPFTMDAKLAKNTMERLKEAINKSSLVLTSHYGYENL